MGLGGDFGLDESLGEKYLGEEKGFGSCEGDFWEWFFGFKCDVIWGEVWMC